MGANMRPTWLGSFVVLALGASAIASCSAGAVRLAPDSATTVYASTGTREVRAAENADASAQVSPFSGIPPALRERWKIGVHPPWMRTAGDDAFDDGYTYVGQEFGATINQYRTYNPHNLPPRCTIPNGDYGPLGMTTDANGTLYFTADFIRAKGVATYGRNCGAPGTRYVENDGNPQDPVVDGSTLYLTTLLGYNQEDPAEIFVFSLAPVVGDHHALRKLSHPSVLTGVGVAVDSHHNLFWSAASQNFNDGFVIEFMNGQMPGKLLPATKLGTDYPGGVMIDHADNLLLIDQNTNTVLMFAPPYTNRPFKTISLMGHALYCALGVSQGRLYCMDVEYGAVDVYTYPGGDYLYSYNNGMEAQSAIGIAIQAPVH
jgi:hypothetical protein